MIWGEFKIAVENAGVTDNMPIDYIDVTIPSVSAGVLVKFDGAPVPSVTIKG